MIYRNCNRQIKKHEEELGEPPEEVIGDKGYYNPEEIKELESEGKVECYIGVQKEKAEEIKFRYIKEEDEYECSEGKRLVLAQKNQKRENYTVDVYQGKECQVCLKRSICTKSKKGRIVKRRKHQERFESYKRKMKTAKARNKLKARKGMIEHCFGTMKIWLGKVPLLLRGKEKVTTEINIYVAAYNLRRLLNIRSHDEIVEQIEAYQWEIA